MSKDPAFLFYSSDFLSGISDLTMEERGQYITLLCLQHQKGRLTKKNIGIAVPNATADTMAKFKIDENGLYYNERLEIEINKRKEFTEKQRQRAVDGWKKRKANLKATANATALPLENENENENKDLIINNNTNIKEEILNSKSWLDSVSMKLRLNNPENLLKTFLNEQEILVGEGNGLNRNIEDIKNHFVKWAKVNNEKQKPTKTNYVI